MEGERHVSVSLQCEVIKAVVEIAEGRLSRGRGLSPQGMPLAFQPLKRTRAKGREVNAHQLLQDFKEIQAPQQSVSKCLVNSLAIMPCSNFFMH